MKKCTTAGLMRLLDSKELQKRVTGNIGLLCHSASLTSSLEIAVIPLQKIFKNRLKKIFGPQHGFVTDVQDNMVETDDFIHPFFKIPVHSLYGHTRIPTDLMLEGLDTILVDLQDVGTRVYTYIWTLTLLMKKCAEKGIKVIVLDRPNPVGGELIEGNMLDPNYSSFVGLYPLPMRHGMTIGEVALYAKKFWKIDCEVEVISMKGWKRAMSFSDTNLPWINPSPNLPTAIGAYTFIGTVLFEGTNISEGRGTTRSLEIVGAPRIEPYTFLKKIEPSLKKVGLHKTFIARPIAFHPMFQKHAGTTCGGVHIHPIDLKNFMGWRVGQVLMRELKNELGDKFLWKQPPYEYEFHKLPIDLINGTDLVRQWIESEEPLSKLLEIEKRGLKEFLKMRREILLY